MNILMVTLAYEPAVAFGGPVQVVKNNARELVRRGHQVTVYCTNRLDLARKIQPHTFERDDQGVRVVYFDTWYIPGWPGNFGPSYSPDLRAYLQREGRGFDVIHINEARSFTTLAVANFARRAGIPYIIQPHGSFALGLRANRLKSGYDLVFGRRIYRDAVHIVALSPAEIDECARVGIPPEKITVVSNGIDLADWQDSAITGKMLRSRYQIDPQTRVILFLSRIDQKKGPDLLIRALAQLDAPDWVCVLAGSDDGYQPQARRLTAELGLTDRVIFAGLLEGPAVKSAFAAADIFVLPSRYDTFPMAVVEAVSSGLPIVITETCQIAEKIRGRAGLVVGVDAAEIAAALQTLLADSETRQHYARGAQNLAQTEFAIQQVAVQIEKIYTQTISPYA